MLHSVHALRFFASLGVVIHHSLTSYGPNLTGLLVGAAGVDIFFVISGVVIGYADHNEGALVFALKQLIRMIPLYWLATLTCALVRHSMYGEVPTWEQVARSLLLVPDFSQPSWFPIYVPAWTLCFEVAFYALFALLLPWAGRATTLSAAIISVALVAVTVPVPFVAGASFDTSYFLEFAVGLLVAEALYRGFRLPPKLGLLSLVLGIIVFAIHRDGWYSSHLLGWGIPAMLVVLGALGLEQKAFWRNRVLVLGGSASYALYLFHLTTMEPLLLWLERSGLDLHSQPRLIALREVILVGSAVCVGVLIHLVVERPMLSTLRRVLLRSRKQVQVTGSASRVPL